MAPAKMSNAELKQAVESMDNKNPLYQAVMAEMLKRGLSLGKGIYPTMKGMKDGEVKGK